MDIHKPKPWHGMREFLKEYVIIVVGVLTALGAEQGVEWLHWQQEVASARATLTPEYVRVIRTAGERAGQSACIGARLDAIGDILDQAAETGRLPAIGPVGQPTRRPWSIRGWDALVSGQVLSHIPERERRVEAAVAQRLDYAARMRDEELTQWAVLGTLMGPGRKVQPGEIALYRGALGIAERNAGIMRVTVDNLPSDIFRAGVVTRAEAAKAWQAGAEEGRRWRLCAPLGTVPIRLSAQGALDSPAGPAPLDHPPSAGSQ